MCGSCFDRISCRRRVEEYMTYASWAEKVNADAAKMVCTVTAELMKLHNHSKKALYDQIRTHIIKKNLQVRTYITIRNIYTYGLIFRVFISRKKRTYDVFFWSITQLLLFLCRYVVFSSFRSSHRQ